MNYGRHRIVKELGRGAMGVVYQAHDPQIDRLVALKVLRPDRVTTEAFLQRFMKEAKAIGRLSHPNMVVVYDVGEDHGTVYIAMEFLEGKPLDEIIKSEAFKPDEIIELGVQVAEALDYAHRKGIIHRDIKPSNIIVQPDGHIKITDFGIAHIEDPEAAQQTQAGEILGTPAYMSPEQVLSQPVDGRSDLFSLGVILYELATGKRPFRGENLAAMFRNITEEDPPEPIKLNPALTRDMSRDIMRCLAKSPEQRFATGKDLAEALRQCGRAAVASPEAVRSTPGKSFPRSLLISLTVAIVAGAIGLAAYYVGVRPSPTAVVIAPEPPKPDSRPGGPNTNVPASEPPISVPAPKLGGLTIDTTPAGAKVLIDGENKGTTPLNIQVPAGAHEIRLVLADYGDWEAQVKVVEDRVTHIPVELVPLEGRK
ncbi:MAG: serine/threonine protein kinase [Syntrophobacteraceae bacterium]